MKILETRPETGNYVAYWEYNGLPCSEMRRADPAASVGFLVYNSHTDDWEDLGADEKSFHPTTQNIRYIVL